MLVSFHLLEEGDSGVLSSLGIPQATKHHVKLVALTSGISLPWYLSTVYLLYWTVQRCVEYLS